LPPLPPSPPGFYTASSITLTPCGATGASGPTLAQCTTAYAGKPWLPYFTMSQPALGTASAAWQAVLLPMAGTYNITVAGASAGVYTSTAAGKLLGRGAVLSYTGYFAYNTTLYGARRGPDCLRSSNSRPPLCPQLWLARWAR